MPHSIRPTLIVVLFAGVSGCVAMDYAGDGTPHRPWGLLANKFELDLGEIDLQSSRTYTYRLKNLPPKPLVIEALVTEGRPTPEELGHSVPLSVAIRDEHGVMFFEAANNPSAWRVCSWGDETGWRCRLWAEKEISPTEHGRWYELAITTFDAPQASAQKAKVQIVWGVSTP